MTNLLPFDNKVVFFVAHISSRVILWFQFLKLQFNDLFSQNKQLSTNQGLSMIKEQLTMVWVTCCLYSLHVGRRRMLTRHDLIYCHDQSTLDQWSVPWLTLCHYSLQLGCLILGTNLFFDGQLTTLTETVNAFLEFSHI